MRKYKTLGAHWDEPGRRAAKARQNVLSHNAKLLRRWKPRSTQTDTGPRRRSAQLEPDKLGFQVCTSCYFPDIIETFSLYQGRANYTSLATRFGTSKSRTSCKPRSVASSSARQLIHKFFNPSRPTAVHPEPAQLFPSLPRLSPLNTFSSSPLAPHHRLAARINPHHAPGTTRLALLPPGLAPFPGTDHAPARLGRTPKHGARPSARAHCPQPDSDAVTQLHRTSIVPGSSPAVPIQMLPRRFATPHGALPSARAHRPQSRPGCCYAAAPPFHRPGLSASSPDSDAATPLCHASSRPYSGLHPTYACATTSSMRDKRLGPPTVKSSHARCDVGQPARPNTQ